MYRNTENPFVYVMWATNTTAHKHKCFIRIKYIRGRRGIHYLQIRGPTRCMYKRMNATGNTHVSNSIFYFSFTCIYVYICMPNPIVSVVAKLWFIIQSVSAIDMPVTRISYWGQHNKHAPPINAFSLPGFLHPNVAIPTSWVYTNNDKKNRIGPG